MSGHCLIGSGVSARFGMTRDFLSPFGRSVV